MTMTTGADVSWTADPASTAGTATPPEWSGHGVEEVRRVLRAAHGILGARRASGTPVSDMPPLVLRIHNPAVILADPECQTILDEIAPAASTYRLAVRLGDSAAPSTREPEPEKARRRLPGWAPASTWQRVAFAVTAVLLAAAVLLLWLVFGRPLIAALSLVLVAVEGPLAAGWAVVLPSQQNRGTRGN
jgi:hypothetical protein